MLMKSTKIYLTLSSRENNAFAQTLLVRYFSQRKYTNMRDSSIIRMSCNFKLVRSEKCEIANIHFCLPMMTIYTDESVLLGH